MIYSSIKSATAWSALQGLELPPFSLLEQELCEAHSDYCPFSRTAGTIECQHRQIRRDKQWHYKLHTAKVALVTAQVNIGTSSNDIAPTFSRNIPETLGGVTAATGVSSLLPESNTSSTLSG